MSTFTVADGQFKIDGQPVMLQAGEFHYFRAPVDQWRSRLERLREAGFNTLATYIPWLWHEVTEGVIDVDGATHPMRDLAGFLDLATEMGFWIIARPGPYIMAETTNEGIPDWVFDNHPDCLFVTPNNPVWRFASYLHPDFRACVSRWYRGVFEVLAPRQITRGGRIVMVQLDNEMGMLQWVTNHLDCNPDTLARFTAYLQATHGPALTARYGAPVTVDLLREGLTDAATPHARQTVEDYRRFFRQYIHDYMAFLLDEAHANGLEVPPVVNIHGFGNGGKTFPIGLSQLVKVLEMDGMVSATDVYPMFIHEGNIHHMILVNEMTRALQNPQQALFSIEFQAGGNLDFSGGQTSLYDLHSRLCVSCGMRAINHYLFFDGENDPILSRTRRHAWGHPVRKDGTTRSHFARYRGLSDALNAYGTDLVTAVPQITTHIGFQIDDYMTEVNHAATQVATTLLTNERDTVLFDLLARGLTLTHRPYAAVELERDELDVAHIPVLWAMVGQQCKAETQRKLIDYVRRGGRLILAGRMCVEDFDHQPCTLLRDALGIEAIDADIPLGTHAITVFGQSDVPVNFLETYTGDFAEVFATRDRGEVVGFIKVLGAGEALVLGAGLTTGAIEDLALFDQLATRMGCPALFSAEPWVDLRLSAGDRGSFVFASNYLEDPVESVITYRGQALFGGGPIRLNGRRGAILPIEWRLADDVTVHYLTSEVRQICRDGVSLTLRTEHPDFVAEISVRGYGLDGARLVSEVEGLRRLRVESRDGTLALRRVGDTK